MCPEILSFLGKGVTACTGRVMWEAEDKERTHKNGRNCLLFATPPLCLWSIPQKPIISKKYIFFPGSCIREMKGGVNLGCRKLLARLARKRKNRYTSVNRTHCSIIMTWAIIPRKQKAKSHASSEIFGGILLFFPYVFFISGSHCV